MYWRDAIVQNQRGYESECIGQLKWQIQAALHLFYQGLLVQGRSQRLSRAISTV